MSGEQVTKGQMSGRGAKMSGFVSKNPGEVSQQKVHMKWLDAILKFFIWQT